MPRLLTASLVLLIIFADIQVKANRPVSASNEGWAANDLTGVNIIERHAFLGI
jgi:hypothetical protein